MRKTLLAAIAKNEAPYLVEWVAHHIAMGFDAIEIYINGTSDQSCEILDAIREFYPSVTYTICDYLFEENYTPCTENYEQSAFERSKLQAYAYSEIINKSHGNFSHVAIMDIDEFLVTKDGKTVNNLLDTIDAEVISIPWLEKKGTSEPFTPSVEPIVVGNIRPTVKSIVKLPTNIKDVKVLSSHNVTYKNGRHYLMGYGYIDKPDTKYDLKLKEHSCLIIHDKNRSAMEYLSKSIDGAPTHKNNSSSGIKINRRGWSVENYNFQFRTDEEIIKLSKSVQDNILSSNIVKNAIHTSRENTINKAKEAEKKIFEEQELFIKMMKSMRNTGTIDYKKIVLSSIKNLINIKLK